MLALRKSIPDRSIFLFLAIFATVFGGLTCIGSAYPSFHAELTSAIRHQSATDTTTFPATLVAETAAENLHPPLGLPAKDGAHVAEITVVNGGLIISVADLKAKVVRHQPIVLVAAPPQPARPEAPDDGTFDLKQEPKVTATPPQRNVLYDP